MGGEGRCMYVMRKVIVWGGVEIGVGGVMESVFARST